MPNIEKYIHHLPSVSKLGLIKHLFEQVPNDYNTVELVISLEQGGVNIKELSSYLDFIYRTHAHLSEIGYAKYVHYPRIQIEIDEVRVGSWEIVIERFLNTVEADKLALIFFSLKFLPNIIQTFSDGIYRYYEILDKREDYIEKKDKRKQRRKIRELINQELELSNLDKKQKEVLVDILEELYKKSESKLKPASRLAQKVIKGVKLNLKKKKR